ncbi:alpha/beta fold hydrolase [Pseudomonas wadenswilerensis]|uniref:Biotin biosynthesis bifunctional protein BioHC n=1 Tax=Pseudomonas wadenswilerensis TaxID=1785161 RepID=A0A380ST42_9PSED|nr:MULTISPECIES: alpha/beta fold hydrolase [Pseudomonas]MCE5984934.1 alpha/beta fold hydrolase [Pseudomonas sp. LF19]UVM21534.1 alpha/beta fold hydrolase [Pseudomonas wadenswilerensis]SPO64647.1 Carboxylesterase [Pseudomonas sp. JV241A]SUQ61157.1 Biotin biosynthesis bifunctional protein BioHC [Pseudomonas wadenswilerensis]
MRNHLILLPGWGLGSSALQPLVATLRAIDPGLRVEIQALPSLVSSNPEDWLDKLDRQLPRNAWLGGWSLGGMLAAELAARRGDDCHGLITLGSNLSFVSRPDWPHGMALDTFQTFLEGCRYHTQVTLKRFVSLCSQGAEEPRSLARLLSAGMPAPAPEQLVAGLEVLGQLDTRAALQRYGGPQLHLFAGRDGLVPAEVAGELLEILPDVEVGLLEDSAHGFVMETPHELAAAIKAFVHESDDD